MIAKLGQLGKSPKFHFVDTGVAPTLPGHESGWSDGGQVPAGKVGVAPACRALSVSRSTFYRRARLAPGRRQPRPAPARALSKVERERVARAPNEVWPGTSPARTADLELLLPLRPARRLQPLGGRLDGRRPESSALAQGLIEEICFKRGVETSVLTLHSDRGAPMTSQGTA